MIINLVILNKNTELPKNTSKPKGMLNDLSNVGAFGGFFIKSDFL